ncbi:4F2 cell-surface antigen heavy chain [Gadus macrocephalus]|uniref:4F2 cell-surface antigen heavy chain n=1 Tax=Gadus macrocephalus TaxID=80720 RepID=UPI0028CB1A76|nr:4F2 cell-surface antigen heavy chain [Gadus macrocephalus]
MDEPRRESLEDSASRRMRLNAGEPAAYGSIVAAADPESPPRGDVEAAPLLSPAPRAVLRPLSKEELEEAAGGPRWTRIRSRLVLLFWLTWLAMLGTAVFIVVKSPRPVAPPLRWWQKSLFYRLQTALFMDSQPGSLRGIEAVCAQLAYIRSLGVGAVVLEGLFLTGASPDGPVLNDSLVTGPQVDHLLKESSKAGLRVVLDLCELNFTASTEVSEVNDTSVSPERLSTVQHALKSWLEKGVAGFAICDTDPAYSERTLTEWRRVIRGLNKTCADRIMLVRQTGEELNSTRSFNGSLVEVVMRSILPPTHHILSAQEVAESMEACLREGAGAVWPSWTMGGRTSSEFQKLLLVLMMTLPGSPALQPGDELSSTRNVTFPEDQDVPSSNTDRERRLALALYTSLSLSKAREEALVSGSFTMLSLNSSSSSTLAPPILGFLRSWGCVQILVVLNVGPDPQSLDPHWAGGLPSAGVFMVGTGLDRMGTVALSALSLRPQEAVVIKLIEARSFSE